MENPFSNVQKSIFLFQKVEQFEPIEQFLKFDVYLVPRKGAQSTLKLKKLIVFSKTREKML